MLTKYSNWHAVVPSNPQWTWTLAKLLIDALNNKHALQYINSTSQTKMLTPFSDRVSMYMHWLISDSLNNHIYNT